jgi:hypothetical protein
MAGDRGGSGQEDLAAAVVQRHRHHDERMTSRADFRHGIKG